MELVSFWDGSLPKNFYRKELQNLVAVSRAHEFRVHPRRRKAHSHQPGLHIEPSDAGGLTPRLPRKRPSNPVIARSRERKDRMHTP